MSNRFTDIENILHQAVVGHHAGELEEAARLYQIVLKRDPPSNIGALRSVGALELQRGRPDAAATALEQARLLCPDDPDVLANFGTARQLQGHLDEAIKSITQAIALAPECAIGRPALP